MRNITGRHRGVTKENPNYFGTEKCFLLDDNGWGASGLYSSSISGAIGFDASRVVPTGDEILSYYNKKYK